VASLGWLPGVGANVRAVTALGDASATVGTAAAGLLEVADQLVQGDQDTHRDEISLAHLEDLVVPLQTLADALERSTEEVAASGEGLVGPVARARDDYLELAVPATEQAATAAAVAEVLPQLLGMEGPRHYLVLAASLSELRSSGGLPGSWSLLRADGGRLHVDEFLDIDELPSLATDVAPPAAELNGVYAARGGLRHWRNINLVAHFPSSGEVALRMWEGLGHDPLDGVIMADTVVFDRLARRVGGFEVPGVGHLEPNEVLPFVAVEAYAAFDDQDQRKRVLGDVATGAFASALAVLESDDVSETAAMLHDIASGGHLRVYARDERIQEVLERVGVAGALPEAPGELAGVLVDNVAGNKADAFTARHLEHRVELLPGGRTEAALEVVLRNDAPREGYPRHVLGPWTPHTQAGDNLSLVRFVCGGRCTHHPATDAVRSTDPDGDLPVAELSLLVPAGDERRVQHRTQTTDGWRFDDGEILVEVAHLVQPTLRPSELQVRVVVPSGWTPTRLPEGAQLEQDEITWRAEASGLVRLAFRMRPTEER
jgi:hypothetical protein